MSRGFSKSSYEESKNNEVKWDQLHNMVLLFFFFFEYFFIFFKPPFTQEHIIQTHFLSLMVKKTK